MSDPITTPGKGSASSYQTIRTEGLNLSVNTDEHQTSLVIALGVGNERGYVVERVAFIADDLAGLRGFVDALDTALRHAEAEYLLTPGLTIDAPEFTVPEEIRALFTDAEFIPTDDPAPGDLIVDAERDVCRIESMLPHGDGSGMSVTVVAGKNRGLTFPCWSDFVAHAERAWRQVPASPADLS